MIMPYTIDKKIAARVGDLMEAYRRTKTILWGNSANIAFHVLMKPDLEQLKAQLESLTKRMAFDCVGLAKVLSMPAPLVTEAENPIHSGAMHLERWKLGYELPPEIDPVGASDILHATQIGDVDFFIALGERLRTLQRRAASKPVDDVLSNTEIRDLNLRLAVEVMWAPSGIRWPDLAYFKNSARWEYLNYTKEFGGLFKSPKQFQNYQTRHGLVPGMPIVSRVTK